MSVVEFRKQEAFDPAEWVMKTVRLDAADVPGLSRYITAYCRYHKDIAITQPGTETHQEAVKMNVGNRLLQHFNAMRIHRSPYYTPADDFEDALYCAAAIALLDHTVTDKAFAKDRLLAQNHDGLREGRMLATQVTEALGLGRADTMELAFLKLGSKGQFVFTLMACQHVRTYLDLKNADPALYNRFKTESGIKLLKAYRAQVELFHTVLLGNRSAMAESYRSMMRTIHYLTAMGERNKIARLTPKT